MKWLKNGNYSDLGFKMLKIVGVQSFLCSEQSVHSASTGEGWP
jgi:hypothetical protein